MFIALYDAVAADSGGKAATLGRMLSAGLPVPDGFVIPFDVYRTAGSPCAEIGDALTAGLARLGDGTVAVRSSASGEDTTNWSGAGQYDTVLGVRGIDDVLEAVGSCWASVANSRAIGYRRRVDGGAEPPSMAVIVQRFVAADVAGVMFTPSGSDEATLIEASWGLGPSVVGGTVTPDSFCVAPNGSVTSVVADKRTRIDLSGDRLVTSEVPGLRRMQRSLTDAHVVRLTSIGAQIARLLGGPQDVEWAVADGRLQIPQARPITARIRGGSSPGTTPAPILSGTPGSAGSATGVARVVRGPQDFGRVRRGDILICPFTDPAWTPLLQVAAGVITETGGVLSHAAIIARELRIPAVLGCAEALTIADGSTITIDGTTGTITKGPPSPH